MSHSRVSPELAHTLISSTISALGGVEETTRLLEQFRRTMARDPLSRAVVLFALAEQVAGDPDGKDAVLSFLEAAIDHFDCFFEDAPVDTLADVIPIHTKKPD